MATRQKSIRYSLGNTVTCEGDIDRVWMFTSGSVWTDETTDTGDSGTGDVAFTAHQATSSISAMMKNLTRYGWMLQQRLWAARAHGNTGMAQLGPHSPTPI